MVEFRHRRDPWQVRFAAMQIVCS